MFIHKHNQNTTLPESAIENAETLKTLTIE
jgi:hypothetical protein